MAGGGIAGGCGCCCLDEDETGEIGAAMMLGRRYRRGAPFGDEDPEAGYGQGLR